MIHKVRDVLRRLAEDGWVVTSQSGSHRQLTNPNKSGKVTTPGKPSDDIAPGTYKSMLKQAGLKD